MFLWHMQRRVLKVETVQRILLILGFLTVFLWHMQRRVLKVETVQRILLITKPSGLRVAFKFGLKLL